MNEEQPQGLSTSSAGKNRWLAAAAIVFFLTSVVGGIYIVQQKHHTAKLEAGYDQMSMALNQTRTQLDMVTAKLNNLSAVPPAQPAPAAAKPAAPKRKTPAGNRCRQSLRSTKRKSRRLARTWRIPAAIWKGNWERHATS
jgi:hypothetical protein